MHTLPLCQHSVQPIFPWNNNRSQSLSFFLSFVISESSSLWNLHYIVSPISSIDSTLSVCLPASAKRHFPSLRQSHSGLYLASSWQAEEQIKEVEARKEEQWSGVDHIHLALWSRIVVFIVQNTTCTELYFSIDPIISSDIKMVGCLDKPTKIITQLCSFIQPHCSPMFLLWLKRYCCYFCLATSFKT